MATMSITRKSLDYALGYTHAEHDRLIRQALRIAPITERLFREAGICQGQRVLDLGSGVGDVSMLLAQIVGASGEVVGIERDANSIGLATERVRAAGFANVRFIQADATEIPNDEPFDAVVGRFILMFLPDPASVLRSLIRMLKPGGVIAFQEPSWSPFLAFNRRFPLYSELLHAIHETFVRSGVNPEMGPDLCRIFQEIDLPVPSMHMEAPMGCDAEFVSICSGVIQSLHRLARQHNVSLDSLGDMETLPERIHEEVAAMKAVISLVPLVGVWARKPMTP